MKRKITLTSDLWFQESLIHTIAYLFEKNKIEVVHLDHKIQRNNLLFAAYNLNAVLPYFETELWHINLVGMQCCSNKYLVVNEYSDCMLICLDNGLATMLNREERPKQYAISFQNENGISNHFTFVETVIKIMQHYQKEGNLSALAEVSHICKQQIFPKSLIQENSIKGRIIFIQYDESIVVNITKTEFEEARRGRNFKYELFSDQTVEKISLNPHEVGEGEPYLLFNDSGYLEIGVHRGGFTNLLKIDRLYISHYTGIHFFDKAAKNNLITIYFE